MSSLIATASRKLLRLLSKQWRRLFWPLTAISPHLLTLGAFAAVYVSLNRWTPIGLNAADFEPPIQLLAQVLSVVVAVLMLGATISLSSYDGGDALADLSTKLSDATQPLFTMFFAGGPARHKLDRPEFVRWLLTRVSVDQLRFFRPPGMEYEDRWYILRSNWDGAWYRVAESPFKDSNHTEAQLWQIQVLHEVVLCSIETLCTVSHLRESGATLLSKSNGTNGTRWFLEEFEKKKNVDVPSSLSKPEAVRLVQLALQSEHYMQEELREHAENGDWTPNKLSEFLLNFSDYTKCMCQLIDKLQILRIANAVQRGKLNSNELNQSVEKLLWLKESSDLRRELVGLRAKIVTAHGTAKYFHLIKRWSVPGIGISLLVLVALLCAWPFLKWSGDTEVIKIGFMLIYSAGIAALVESSFFLVRLLWARRTR